MHLLHPWWKAIMSVIWVTESLDLLQWKNGIKTRYRSYYWYGRYPQKVGKSGLILICYPNMRYPAGISNILNSMNSRCNLLASQQVLCTHSWFDKIFEKRDRITTMYNYRRVALPKSVKLLQRTETTAPSPSVFISVFFLCESDFGCCLSKISNFGEAGTLLLRSDKMSNHTPEGNLFGLTIQRKSSA